MITHLINKVTDSNTTAAIHTRAHVNEGVVDQHQFVEVELIGESFPFGLMENPLVVVISVQ